MSSTPCPSESELHKLVTGNISTGEQAALAQHIDGCALCQVTLDRLGATPDSWSGLAEHLAEKPAVEPALANVMDHLQASPQETTAEPHHVADSKLDFLDPSQTPGHLGRLGHYEVLDIVGKGGMGIVLRVYDTKLQRVCAIKVMKPELAASASARQRFIREARAAAAVSHDHIVTIHAVHDDHSPPYLVMQYISGRSLQQRIDDSGALQLKEILRIGLQAASGLAAAHAQGLVHRDIKPANILLENGVERVKITDFGLARVGDDSRVTQTGVVTGTPQYMAPEQARGESVDQRADLFSLGGVLYAMCTGYAPFRASSSMAVLKKVCDETPRPIRDLNPEIPDWLVAIVDKLMAKDAAERFQTAAEVAALLGQHLAHLQQPAQVAMPARIEAPRSAVADSAIRSRQPSLLLPILLMLVPLLILPILFVMGWTTGIGMGIGEAVVCLFVVAAPFALIGLVLFIRRLTSAPVTETRQPIRVAATSVAQPKQRNKAWVAVVIVIVLGVMAVPVMVVGLAISGLFLWSSSDSARVQQGISAPPKSAAAPVRPDFPKQRVLEGLNWFPREATFFGAIDFKSHGSLTAKSRLVQALVEKLLPPQERDLFAADVFADMRLDRVSFALVEQPQKPADSRLFVRLTGQTNRIRLTRMLLEKIPGAATKPYTRVDAEQVTVITSPKEHAIFALIGDTDVLMAGHLGQAIDENRKYAVVDEALEIRLYSNSAGLSWQKPNIALGSYSNDLQNLPSDTSMFLLGDVPLSLRQDLVSEKGPLQALPRFVKVVGSDKKLQFEGRMSSPAEATEFFGWLDGLKRQAVVALEEPAPDVSNDVPKPTTTALILSLKNILLKHSGATVTVEAELTDELLSAALVYFRALGPLYGSSAIAPPIAVKKTEPAGETVLMKFTPDKKPITTELELTTIKADKDGWVVTNGKTTSTPEDRGPRIRLFELLKPDLAGYRVTVRCKIRSEKVAWARLYLRDSELASLSTLQGRNVEGSTNWTDYEFSHEYKLDKRPEQLAVDVSLSAGTIWFKDLELVKTPLPELAEWWLLQGTWRAIEGEVDGKSLTAEQLKKWKIRADKTQFTLEQDARVLQGEVCQLAPANSPMHFLSAFATADSTYLRMLYQLEGDTLKVCGMLSGTEVVHPTEFSTKAGSGRWLVTFKRASNEPGGKDK